ncbi:unnamed protein product [Fusarium venenatum]|uniref:PhoD-like phosphatase domain-containing protein n=1 Tax=Fusarium venenatum TaxID=56646 RepID=A0A2L2TUK2_9HYPO|nr:uncharacterized protein FVRRES_00427 [Fusarium venenatum]KAH7006326.1 hypothetical protein EDB82DRAFT_114817 [Fusarium venenatum]CEI63915.1 unnamed protein product [Fusarium venenatum]
MSTPYWGQLPGPKVVQGSNRRRSESDNYTYNADRRSSLDIAPVRKSNRVSSQTQGTDALSESTFSPYDSPTTPGFAPQGLAPRPSSYRRDISTGESSKPRYNSRQQQAYDEPLSPAQEAPRGPPVNYRHPYGNGGPSNTHTAPNASASYDPNPQDDDMEDDQYQRSSQRTGGQRYDQGQDDFSRRGSSASAYDQLPRRTTGGSSKRQKAYADDRSPLQRLELTLDSMTKEEKRARVEAAEKRARARQAKQAGKQPASGPQVQQSHERKPSVTYSERRPSGGGAFFSAGQPSAHRDVSQNYSREAPRDTQRDTQRDVPQDTYQDIPPQNAPREETASPFVYQELPPQVTVQRGHSHRRRSSVAQRPADDMTFGSGALRQPAEVEPAPRRIDPQSAVPRTVEQDSGIPQRNLSFRERATRDNAQLPEQPAPAPAPAPAPMPMPMSMPQTQPVQPPAQSGGFSLTRSGSNKLRKPPPPDLNYPRRVVSERRAPAGPPISKYCHQFDDDYYYDDQDDLLPARQIPQELPTRQNTQQITQELNDRFTREKELPPNPPQITGAHEYIPTHQEMPMPGDNQGIKRRVTDPAPRVQYADEDEFIPPPQRTKSIGTRLLGRKDDDGTHAQNQAAVLRKANRADSFSSESSEGHHISRMVFKQPEDMVPGDGLYLPPTWLDEWRKGTVGTLSGTYLDIQDGPIAEPAAHQAWWEQDKRKSFSEPRNAEAFDGEYDEQTPTRFKPALFMKCGPLLRYCGIKREKVPNRAGNLAEREMWRGSIMIVTQDSDSSYDIAPTLRLFVQSLDLLPAPPHSIKGDLSPEYVDPIAGHPKVGRRGETLYVRPVDHLEEAKDLSRDETDTGLFEQTITPLELPGPDGPADLPGSFANRRKRAGADGEKVQKYKDIRGFRLHTERGCTFWRFNIEVELRENQQRIAYRINRGPATGFWVPAKGETMNMMFHSCNGFSASVKPDELSGPDPMWRDVLNNHQSRPFHLMIGGGDQIYNDCVSKECSLFKEWLNIRNPIQKHTAALTPEMQDELETFYLERYCMWFSQGLFGLANSQIPMVNMWDDHDIFDGYGSYPHHDMKSPIMSGLGAVAHKYYMLFQHQSIMTELENTEPSWILGNEPGPYINELGRSLFLSVGSKVGLLAVDCRTERTEHDVVSDKSWEKIMNRLYAEVRRGQVEHLMVLLGIPIAYPRLVWLENILTSRLMDPVKALGRTGVLGKALNNIDGGVEVLDDLNDHWTAKSHKQERSVVIEDLQDLAIDKSLRVTILSGDVHLAAVGQFYSNPKLGLAKHKDPRYMPNIISSAIANTPPPDMLADVLNKRNKVHHFDKQTDEDMIPLFQQGVDGKPRNNKHLLPHRNWCAIREWQPGSTPPPTPPGSSGGESSAPKGGLLRRLSLSRSKSTSSDARPDFNRETVRGGSRPPVTRGGGGLFRSLSRRNSTSSERPPAKLQRSMSVDQAPEGKKSGFFGFIRRPSQRRAADEGDMNDRWEDQDPYYDDPDYYEEPLSPQRGGPGPSGMRGGAAYDEYTEGDDSYFMAARPLQRAQTVGSRAMSHSREAVGPMQPMPRPGDFYRTPTGLSTKQKKQADKYTVDLEGGLDITLNVEINPKDPAGITKPYRLLVPKLFYDYENENENEAGAVPEQDPQMAQAGAAEAPEPTGFKRLLSFRRKAKNRPPPEDDDYSEDDDDDIDVYRVR